MFGTMPLMSEGLAEVADGLGEAGTAARAGLVYVTMRVNGIEILPLDTGSPSGAQRRRRRGGGIRCRRGGRRHEPVRQGQDRRGGGARWRRAGRDDRPANGPVMLRKIPRRRRSPGDAEIGAGRPYVGELPGLAALGGLGADAGPRPCRDGRAAAA